MRPLRWNAWFAEDSDDARARFTPIKRLAPRGSYRLPIHLSTRKYSDDTSARTISAEWQRRLAAIAQDTTEHETRVTILAIPDERYLRIREPVTTLTVDIERLSKWLHDPSFDESEPLDHLGGGGDPSRLVLGAAMLTVEPTGRAEGETSVGLSIWGADGLPIDELRVPICIASPDRARALCKRKPTRDPDIGGYEFPRRRTQEVDAALHVFSLGESGVVAAFRRNDIEAPFASWKVGDSESGLLDRLTALTDELGEEKNRHDTTALADIGERIYRVLFAAGDPQNHRARTARAAFEAYACPRMDRSPPAATEAPLLYLRFLHNRRLHETRQLPLSLAKVDPARSDSFLGQHFRVESPLAVELAKPLKDCVSSWATVIPAIDSTDFGVTRKVLNESVPGWFNGRLFDRMRDFRNWLSMATTEADPTALVVLSHHELRKNTGRLSVDGEYVTSDHVVRDFDQPSIAILNGCGTAQPGAEDFINALNRRGFDAIVATRHTVSKQMAADYFACLSEQLYGHDAPSDVTLGEAHYEALQCLSQRRPEHAQPVYGVSALAYGIFGNTELRLCQPTGRPGVR